MITFAIGVRVVISQAMPELRKRVNRFQNRDAVRPAPAHVIDFTASGMVEELQEKAGHIMRMDLVADLFAFIAENRVLLSRHRTVHNLGQITVQFYGGMLGAGKAAAAENSYRHSKVPAELLAQNVSRSLGCSKQRVEALVD